MKNPNKILIQFPRFDFRMLYLSLYLLKKVCYWYFEIFFPCPFNKVHFSFFYGTNLDRLYENQNYKKILFDQGRTALHLAIHWSRMECAKVLIHRGASLNIRDSSGNHTIIFIYTLHIYYSYVNLSKTLIQRLIVWKGYYHKCLYVHYRRLFFFG